MGGRGGAAAAALVVLAKRLRWHVAAFPPVERRTGAVRRGFYGCGSGAGQFTAFRKLCPPAAHAQFSPLICGLLRVPGWTAGRPPAAQPGMALVWFLPASGRRHVD